MEPSEPPAPVSTPSATYPTTPQLVVAAALGFLAGSLGTWGLLRHLPADTPSHSARSTEPPAPAQEPTDGGPRRAPDGTHGEAPIPSPRKVRPPADDGPRTATIPPDAPRPASPAKTTPDAAAPPRAEPTGVATEQHDGDRRNEGLALLPGRIAYLRCPGPPPRPGPYPCPRHLPLERRLWRTLAGALLRCEPPFGAGRADVRFVFDGRGAPPRVVVARGFGDLPAERIEACLAQPSASLRLPPPYRRLAVSLRFTLLPAAEAPEEALVSAPLR